MALGSIGPSRGRGFVRDESETPSTPPTRPVALIPCHTHEAFQPDFAMIRLLPGRPTSASIKLIIEGKKLFCYRSS
jgi:hypothetical protein